MDIRPDIPGIDSKVSLIKKQGVVTQLDLDVGETCPGFVCTLGP